MTTSRLATPHFTMDLMTRIYVVKSSVHRDEWICIAEVEHPNRRREYKFTAPRNSIPLADEFFARRNVIIGSSYPIIAQAIEIKGCTYQLKPYNR